MEAIRRGEARLDGLAEDLAAVARRAFATDPSSRYPSMDELRDALTETQRRDPSPPRASSAPGCDQRFAADCANAVGASQCGAC